MRLMKGTYGTIWKQASRIWNKTFRGAVYVVPNNHSRTVDSITNAQERYPWLLQHYNPRPLRTRPQTVSQGVTPRVLARYLTVPSVNAR
jgi:hypothetical protein